MVRRERRGCFHMTSNNDTTVRISKDKDLELSYVKGLLSLVDKKNYSKDDIIKYALDFVLDNDEKIKQIHRSSKYYIERGRHNEIYE
jgi:hypothetical protein